MSGGKVDLSEGVFGIAAAIENATNNVWLRGQGSGSTILRAAVGIVTPVIDIQTNLLADLEDLGIFDLQVDANDQGVSAIKVNVTDVTGYPPWRQHLENLVIKNVSAGYAIDMDSIMVNYLTNIWCSNVKNGLRIRNLGLDAGKAFGNSKVTSLRIDFLLQNGVGIDLADCEQITGMHWDVSSAETGCTGLKFDRAKSINIYGIDIENVLIGILCDGVAAPWDISQRVNIQSGYVGLKGADDDQIGLRLTDLSAQCFVSNVHFDGPDEADASIGVDADGENTDAPNKIRDCVIENFNTQVSYGAASTDEFKDNVWPDGGSVDGHINDPGDGNAIPAYRSGQVPLVTTAGNETRTLAAPASLGRELALYLKTNGGVDVEVTVTGDLDSVGNDKAKFTAIGQALFLRAVESGGNLRWRLVNNDGTTLS